MAARANIRQVRFQSPPGRYEIVKRLGQGGMADVYLGWMHSLGGIRRKVAIKRILPELVQKQRDLFSRMFEDEARLGFLLEHDNIVRVYDVGQCDVTFFVVMEYIDGLDLRRIFAETTARNHPLAVADVLTIGARVAAGLAYAHGFGDGDGRPLSIIHNDISPPNILVGRKGEVKIADFGLADARIHLAEAPSGVVKGKFAYLSPETAIAPDSSSCLSDIFSLGTVLWELLANRRLFLRNSDLETLRAVQQCKIPPLREIRPEVPARLAAIVQQTLDPDPETRYSSAEALRSDLVGLSYELGLPLTDTRLGRLVRRYKWFSDGEADGDGADAAEAEALLAKFQVRLPPSTARHLASFVTSLRIYPEPEQTPCSRAEAPSWQHLLDEVGFKGDEDLFVCTDRCVQWKQLGLPPDRRDANTVLRRPKRQTGDPPAVPEQAPGSETPTVSVREPDESTPERSLPPTLPALPRRPALFDTRALVLALLLGLGVGLPLGALLCPILFKL